MMNEVNYNNPEFRFKELKDLDSERKLIKDFYKGAEGIIEYIYKFALETKEAYEVRKKITPYKNFIAPAIDSIVNLVTRKDVVINGGFELFDNDNVDLKGNSLNQFIKIICRESLIYGASFVAVHSYNNTNRYYFKKYKYEDLYNFRINIEDNKVEQYTFRDQVMLPKGEFGREKIERFFVYRKDGGSVYYRASTNEPLKEGSEWKNKLGEPAVVSFITGLEETDLIIHPKFHDLAILNKQHLNLFSQRANILYLKSNPALCIFGPGPKEDESLSLNSNQALSFQNKQTEGLEYVEIKGEGVDQLQETMLDIEKTVNEGVNNLFIPSIASTKIEAYDTSIKNNSYVKNVAIEMEKKINKLYDIYYRLINKTKRDQDKIELSKEFDDILVANNNINMFHDLVREGNLSLGSFYDLLKKSGQLPNDFDIEKELELLESESESDARFLRGDR